jgi:hypothetical protein
VIRLPRIEYPVFRAIKVLDCSDRLNRHVRRTIGMGAGTVG